MKPVMRKKESRRNWENKKKEIMKHNRKDEMVAICVYLEIFIQKLKFVGLGDLESFGKQINNDLVLGG